MIENKTMTFEEFIRTTKLPSTAKEQLPGILSEKVKTALISRFDAEEIIETAINEINYGSVETMEILIEKILQKRTKGK